MIQYERDNYSKHLKWHVGKKEHASDYIVIFHYISLISDVSCFKEISAYYNKKDQKQAKLDKYLSYGFKFSVGISQSLGNHEKVGKIR